MRRLYFYQQLENSDCGITCVRIIARYWGRKISPHYLRSLNDSCRLGITISDITETLEAIGMNTIALKLTLEEIQKSDFPLPAIIYWNHAHFVVLYKIKKNKFYIADPGKGKMQFDRVDFNEIWLHSCEAGIVILAEPTALFYDKDFPQQRPRKALWELMRDLISNNRIKFAVVSFLILLTMTADVLTPLLFQSTVDEGISGHNISLVWLLVLAQLCVFMGNYLGGAAMQYVLSRLSLQLSLDMMYQYLSKLIKLPLMFFARKVNSDLIQKADDQVRIKDFLVNLPHSTISTVITAIVFSVMLIYYSLPIFFLFIGAIAIGILWNNCFLRRRRELDFSYYNAVAENRNNIYELIYGMPDIKVNSAEQIKIKGWNAIQKRINQVSIKSLRLKTLVDGGNTTLSYMKDIVITGVCATMVIESNMSLGAMMTVGYIVGRLSTPFTNIIGIFSRIQDASMSMERVAEIMESPEKEEGMLRCKSNFQFIRLENVWFKYPGSSSPYVLRDINMKITCGSTVAIVGLSGGGKTTLLKLILGLFSPTSGDVYLDNDRLQDIQESAWLKICGAVLQDGKIFSGTILENIAVSDERPDLNKAKSAIDMACLHDFIESLPMGINTKIGVAGIELSGGEKQRLLIARAMYKEPKLLILDEATSSLDASNEAAIVSNLHKFAEGRTLIIVAHRLSTVRHADKILFVKDGKVAETGTHEELVKLKGGYFKLISNQLEIATA